MEPSKERLRLMAKTVLCNVSRHPRNVNVCFRAKLSLLTGSEGFDEMRERLRALGVITAVCYYIFQSIFSLYSV
jgi:hypothetical protein